MYIDTIIVTTKYSVYFKKYKLILRFLLLKIVNFNEC